MLAASRFVYLGERCGCDYRWDVDDREVPKPAYVVFRSKGDPTYPPRDVM